MTDKERRQKPQIFTAHRKEKQEEDGSSRVHRLGRGQEEDRRSRTYTEKRTRERRKVQDS